MFYSFSHKSLKCEAYFKAYIYIQSIGIVFEINYTCLSVMFTFSILLLIYGIIIDLFLFFFSLCVVIGLNFFFFFGIPISR